MVKLGLKPKGLLMQVLLQKMNWMIVYRRQKVSKESLVHL